MLAFRDEKGMVEAISMHKFPKACNKMVSREHLNSLKMRFLDKQEREQMQE